MKLSLRTIHKILKTRRKRKSEEPSKGDPLSTIESLPTEIITEILHYSAEGNRAHLKTLRLVCHQWSDIASIKLFNTLVVSPSDLNTNAFKSVSSHPTYAQYVKTLIYDASRFRSTITTVDAYSKALFRDDQETEDVTDRAKRRSKKLLMSVTGLKKYQRQAEEQTRHLESSSYQDLLVEGLKHLPNLHEVDYRTFWDQPCIHDKCDNKGRGPGALARAWNASHLKPRGSSLDVDQPDSHWQFIDLARAISASGQALYSLIYQEAWYEGSFNLPFQHLTAPDLKAIASTLKPLKHLNVTLGWESGYFSDWDASAHRAKFLQYASNVEILGLHRWNFPAYTGLKDYVWSNLKELHFPASSITEAELLNFLRAHKSTLRHVCFSQGAFFGKWANVLDYMHEHLHLITFNFTGLPQEYIEHFGHRHRYETIVGDLEDGEVGKETIKQTGKAMEDYVLHGGENPLRSDKVKIRMMGRRGNGTMLSGEALQMVKDAPPADPFF